MAKILAVIAAFVVLFGAVRQGDILSCQRSNTVRMSQQGYEQYARDAAAARLQSALVLAKTNPALALIDREASAKFLADANRTHIVLIDCSGIFPVTK